jgi:acyl-CoA thioester hydrolase
MDKFRFYEPIRVRFAETDAQGHVFFGNYLTYFDEALTQYQHAIGCTYQDVLALGLDYVYAHSECDYLSRAFFEQTLNVHARAGRIGNSSITFEFAAFNAADDEMVTTGKIVAVVIDRATNKTAPVPKVLRDAVMKYENSNLQ